MTAQTAIVTSKATPVRAGRSVRDTTVCGVDEQERLDRGADAWLRRSTSRDWMTGVEIEWDTGQAAVRPGSRPTTSRPEPWVWTFTDIAFGHSEESRGAYDTLEDAEHALVARVDDYYDIHASGGESSSDVAVLLRAVESFVSLWNGISPTLWVDPDDRRIGDALAAMAAELVKTENPPKSVLRTSFEWFAHKLDVFAEEAAKSAGSTAGKAGMIAGTVAASGQLPKLVEAASNVLKHLG